MLGADTPSLGKSLRQAEYRVALNAPLTPEVIHGFISVPEIQVEYEKAGKTKKVNARKGVVALKPVDKIAGQSGLLMRLSLKESSPPLIVLAALLQKEADELCGLRAQRLRFFD